VSIIKELFPVCDICGDTFADMRGQNTAKNLRDSMRLGGWKRRGGKDVCFDCARDNRTNIQEGPIHTRIEHGRGRACKC
jgi:hypothetical protein